MTETTWFVGQTLSALRRSGSDYSRPQPTASGIDLGVGEVRFEIPMEIRTELADVLTQAKQIGYSDPHGEYSLRNTYLKHLIGDNAVSEVSPLADVLVTSGGKEAVWLAIGLALHVGRVKYALIPHPGWEPYGLLMNAAGCSSCRYDPAMLIDSPELLADLVRSSPTQPGLLILNYPHNPTGVSLSQFQINRVIDIARELRLQVISDEVYRSFAPEFASAALAPGFDWERDFVIDSCSKWLAMAGLRVGFMVSGSSYVNDAAQVRSTYASCASVLTQQLASAMLRSEAANGWLEMIRHAVAANRKAVSLALRARRVPVESDGSLYVWARIPDISELPDQGSIVAARMTLGDTFGFPGYFRLCVARPSLDANHVALSVIAALRAANV